MDIAKRIYELRKVKGLSQEQLANEIGVSRQAVSKWESQQSLPELDKVIILSEYFHVSTDYLLTGKGTAPKGKDHVLGSQILYFLPVFLIFMGVICSMANWYENQYMTDIFVGFLIIGAGMFFYFVGTAISSCPPMTIIKRLNLIMGSFIPLALFSNFLMNEMLAPYPLGIYSRCLFCLIYFLLSCLICWKIK